MTVKIDKKIPLPPLPRGEAPNAKWPWHGMNVGDSFLMPGAQIRSASSGAVLAGKRRGQKFTCRTVNGGVRIWRIK